MKKVVLGASLIALMALSYTASAFDGKTKNGPGACCKDEKCCVDGQSCDTTKCKKDGKCDKDCKDKKAACCTPASSGSKGSCCTPKSQPK